MEKIKNHLVGLPFPTSLLPARGCRRQILYFRWLSLFVWPRLGLAEISPVRVPYGIAQCAISHLVSQKVWEATSHLRTYLYYKDFQGQYQEGIMSNEFRAFLELLYSFCKQYVSWYDKKIKAKE
jgi:hypothetical protein